MIDFGTVSKNKTEARESPILWLPGVDDYFHYQVDGTGSIVATAMYLYENGTDVSATKLSDALSQSGRVIKTKKISGLVGGSSYKVYLQFTDNGIDNVHEVTIYCPRLGVNPSNYPLAKNQWRIKESPILIYPLQSYPITLQIDGNGTLASATMVVYKGMVDDSANVLASDTIVITGRSITLKRIENLSGGNNYLLYVFFTDNGRESARYAEIICPKLGER
jgi:hypothetical protein